MLQWILILFCDIWDPYFNMYTLPLSHLGIVKKTNFPVTDIFRGTLCFYLGLSVYSKFTLAPHSIWGILCHHLTSENSICAFCQGKKLRSKWSDVFGPAVSLFPFNSFLLFLKFNKEKLRHVHICCMNPCTDSNCASLLSRVRLFATPQTSPPGSSVHGDSPGKNTGVGCYLPNPGTEPRSPTLQAGSLSNVTRDRNWITVKRLEIFRLERILTFYIYWESWGNSYDLQFFLNITLRNWV